MRRKVRIFASVLPLAFLLIGLAVNAQEYKIRAKVDLVVVPVTVKGSDDELVTGLDQKDFIITESGRRQTISNFTIDPVPLSAAVVIDTGLSPGSLSKVQQSLTALAGAFSEFDEVAVYRYDKFVTKISDFAPNTERVEVAMKTIVDIKPDDRPMQVPGNSPFSVPGPVINGQAVVPAGQLGVLFTTAPKISRVLNDAIFAAASDLANRERSRRRIIVAISDGQTGGNDHSLEETTQRLLQFGVEVYSVGLDQPGPFKAGSPLSHYAKATGGDVYFADSLRKIEESYASITEEARNQYILGYLSNNEVVGPDPVFREIEVTILGKNLKAIHRKGYYQYP